ncbi:MAG: DUF3333 domain-containing protein, partial [Jannaschia sp.]
MTDVTATPVPSSQPRYGSILEESPLAKRRNAAEQRFRYYGMFAVGVGLFFLLALLFAIVRNGIPAFTQTYVTLQIELPADVLDPNGNRNIEDLKRVSTFGYNPLIDAALERAVSEQAIETDITDGSDLRDMLSSAAGAQLRDAVLANPDVIGTTQEFRLLASSRVDGYMKGRVTRVSLERDRNLSPGHLNVVDSLVDIGTIERTFNWPFILGADASESRPEQAGMGVSILGSFFMMLVVLFLALPIGVAASIYLE